MSERSRRAASPASTMAVTSSAEANMAKNRPHNAIEPLTGFDATTLPLPGRSLGSASIQDRRPSRNRASGTTSWRAFSVSLNRPPIAAVPRPTSPMRSAAVAISRITRSHNVALRRCGKVMPPVPFCRLTTRLSGRRRAGLLESAIRLQVATRCTAQWPGRSASYGLHGDCPSAPATCASRRTRDRGRAPRACGSWA